MDLLALAAAFAQPPDYLVAWQRAVGDDAEQFEAGGELLGGKRQLRGIVQVQLAQRFADRQEAGALPAVAGPVRHEADLGELLVGPVALTLRYSGCQSASAWAALRNSSVTSALTANSITPNPCLPHSTAAGPAGSPPTQINLGYAGGRGGQAVLQHPKLLVTSRDIAVSELRVQHGALFRHQQVSGW